MTRPLKVVLLSGLVFPGIGHLALKHYLRASILIIATLIALSAIVTVTVRHTLSVVESGAIPLEAGAITELVSSSISSADNSIIDYSLLVVVACWLVGIIDSYRLAKS